MRPALNEIDKSQRHKCSVCQFYAETEEGRATHALVHSTTERPYRCHAGCVQWYEKSADDMQTHYERVHYIVNKTLCELSWHLMIYLTFLGAEMVDESDTRVHAFPLRNVRIERPPAPTLSVINDQTLIEPQLTLNESHTDNEELAQKTRLNKRKATTPPPVVDTKRLRIAEENHTVSVVDASVLPQADSQSRTNTEQALQVGFCGSLNVL